jgi:hypothetical protein
MSNAESIPQIVIGEFTEADSDAVSMGKRLIDDE